MVENVEDRAKGCSLTLLSSILYDNKCLDSIDAVQGRWLDDFDTFLPR